MVAPAAEAQVKALVTHALALQPRSHPHLRHQIDSELLQHSGAYAIDYVLAVAGFENDGVDSFQMQ
jgi:hypothetical protein